MISERVLPPEEWHRLDGFEVAALLPFLKPEDTCVLVIEDDGKIVGTWTGTRLVHAEGLEIIPSHRGSFGVAKRLLRGMRAIAWRFGVDQVRTGSTSEHVNDLLYRMGGKPIPYLAFVLPMGSEKRTIATEKAVCQQL